MNSYFPIALHVLGFLASRNGEPLTSEVLAKTYGTSPVVLRRVLSKLQRAGLIDTQRGAGGGSVLAREASSINLKDAYKAVANETEILTRHPDSCAGSVAPVLAIYVNDLLGEAEKAMLRNLEAITVESMDKKIRAEILNASNCTKP